MHLYPIILFQDFIEQRAKVLDPTSRSLLMNLKNQGSTTQSQDTTSDPLIDDLSSPELTSKAVRHQTRTRFPDDLYRGDLNKKLILSKNLILEGVPGTGKTFAFKHDIIETWSDNWIDEDKARRCQKDAPAITMHPSTSYEDFIDALKI